MRDAEIREQLTRELTSRYPGDLVRGELGLCLGETRVDVAVVNGHLHGYEIKSDRDTLTRLTSQVELYDRVLDYSTVVCGERHVTGVLTKIPDRWGIVVATMTQTRGVTLLTVRKARLNRHVDRLAIAQLLWRDEAAAILRDRGGEVRARETRWDLWDRLATLPLRTLRPLVRDALKARPLWPGG